MSDSPLAEPTVDWRLLEPLRRAEKEQTVRYRRLAARAEADGLGDLAQRFHDLHADEQHHLSRLTARILELGGRPEDFASPPPTSTSLDGVEDAVRRAEEDEIAAYQDFLRRELDAATRELVEEILGVERQHAREMGGKWTMA